MTGSEFVPLSLVPMLIGICVAVACALPGNFLLLRRQALIGDAISHVVLPGIVVAFLLTGVVSTWPMLLGAAGAALVAVLAIDPSKRKTGGARKTKKPNPKVIIVDQNRGGCGNSGVCVIRP